MLTKDLPTAHLGFCATVQRTFCSYPGEAGERFERRAGIPRYPRGHGAALMPG